MPEFEFSKRKFETRGSRIEAARLFIESLSSKPLYWKVSGSTKAGNFRPDNDIDIDALYEKKEAIPYNEISSRMDSDNGLVDEYIDFHYFAKDWKVYEHDPELLKKFESSFLKDE